MNGLVEHWRAGLALVRTWRDLDLHEVSGWPILTQRVLMLAVTLTVLLALALIFGWPTWQSLQTNEEQSQHLARQIQAQTRLLAGMPKIQERVVQGQLESLRRRFPVQLQTQMSLQVIDELARAHHISLLSVRVKPFRDYDTHQAQPIEIEAVADFHDWGRWMAALLNAEPLMWVSRLDAQASGVRGVDVRLSMTLIAAAQPRPVDKKEGKR